MHCPVVQLFSGPVVHSVWLQWFHISHYSCSSHSRNQWVGAVTSHSSHSVVQHVLLLLFGKNECVDGGGSGTIDTIDNFDSHDC